MNPAGPKYPGTAADSAGGGAAWTNVNNIKLEDASVATSGLIGPGGGGAFPNQLQASNFGFAIPSTAVITGIKLEAKVQSAASAVTDYDIHLQTTGGVSTPTASTPSFGQAWPTGALTWLTWGGDGSLWGRAWTPAEINSASFMGSISGYPGTGTGTVTVDAIRVTVYWTTAPADVPKRYVYQAFDNANSYIGNLPTPISEFGFAQDINTAGSQIIVEVPVSADTAALASDVYTDEAGVPYTNEAGTENYSTEGQIPIISPGASGTQVLLKNGNRIVVYEYSYYYPNGIAVFSGQVNRISAGFGGASGETVKVLVLSDGLDLDNLIARGAPFTYTTDQSQVSQNASDTLTTDGTKGTGYNKDGESFQTGPSTTNVGAITLMLGGTARVTVKLWDSPAQAILLGSITQSVSVANGTIVQFGFAVPITVTPSTNYFFSTEVDPGQSILIYYQNTDVYVLGSRYNASYGGGGGGAFAAATGDLYFLIGTSAGSTTGTYSSVDPTTGMLKPIIDDYVARGGRINYATGTVDASGLSLTYTFNTNTIYEAIKAILSICPNGFYYYVDLGTNILYFKQASTTADIMLTKGRHIEDLQLVSSIENIKNQMLFSGGLVGASNLYKQYQDQTSIALYGVRLQRQSDNRVTLDATANAIGSSFIATNKDEQYQTTLTVTDKYMDTTLLKPGKIIGFNGFGTFVDNLTAQIVHIEYSPHEVSITLGILPKRLNPEFEKVTRGLIAQQTVANPTAPS